MLERSVSLDGFREGDSALVTDIVITKVQLNDVVVTLESSCQSHCTGIADAILEQVNVAQRWPDTDSNDRSV